MRQTVFIITILVLMILISSPMFAQGTMCPCGTNSRTARMSRSRGMSGVMVVGPPTFGGTSTGRIQ